MNETHPRDRESKRSGSATLQRWISFLAAAAPPRFHRAPYKLTYIVTDECSCRCAICLLWKAPRKGQDLATIERFFRANPQLSWINLSGGEVAERDDFAAIVESAVIATKVLVLDFPTAGQSPRTIESAVRGALSTALPRLFVTVSIDGPPAVHDVLRGTPGAFDRARETLARLRAIPDRRLSSHVGLTFSSRNDADPEGLVSALLAAAPELRREDLHFNLAHHAPHYYKNRPADRPDRARLRRFLLQESTQRDATLEPFALLERAYWRLAADYLATDRSPLPCAALSASAYVDPDLVLYPCATWDRPIARLEDHDYSIDAALRTTEAMAAARAARSLDCPNCFTPCEAYPTILTERWRTLARCAEAPSTLAANR